MVSKEDGRLSETNFVYDSEGNDVLIPADDVFSDTEVVESTEAVSGSSIVVDSSSIDSIATDVHLILVFVILTFCTACLRGWRIKALKGV